MSDNSMNERLIISNLTQPRLSGDTKLRHDEGVGSWVIVAPERVFTADQTAVAVLKLCDGNTTVSDISGQLAREYQASADEIGDDIITLLQELADKGVVTS